LIRNNKNFAEKIVEVHSLFSEELYYKLFKSDVKNKIILATNIGESSITLPNCKVVIDYCLNRNAVKNDKEGISRFSTRVASLSNLIQRKGRVGRVSDGIVYRMITKLEF
jgi:ATP-dependent RNA helicase TDRD9